jgi:hypothetical protein
VTPGSSLASSSPWQGPLHGECIAGIGVAAAAGDDTEIAARLGECLRVDVRLFGRLLDIGHLLGATGERVAEQLLRALAAFGRRAPVDF